MKLWLGCALAALVAAVSLSGCGSDSSKAQIEAAIRSSPYTYFAVRRPLYWGRRVHLTIERVRISRVDRRYAAAAVRAWTAAEWHAIVAATRAEHFKPGQDSCIRYRVRVSRIDPRYVRVDYAIVPPTNGCLLGNGWTYMERRPDGRRRVTGDASDFAGCTWLPPGVARSVDGACILPGEAD